ncbi:MAG: site-specific integrase [Acidobacteriota bacterium]|nr:site-specific integrase [Acidobacteriota bacterium]
MAEIVKHVARDGTVSYKVKIFLGRVDGKRQFKIKTIRGKRAKAEEWAREQETLRDTGKLPLDEKITLEEWLEKWLKTAEKRVRLTTLRGYRAHIRRYVYAHVISNMPLVKIKTFHVQEFYDSMEESGLSPRTIEYVHTLLSGALNHAVGQELIERNPAAFTKRPTKQKPVIECFSSEQAEKFLEAARSDKLYVMFVVALTLGLRPEEYCALKWQDIDFENGIMRVERAVKFYEAVYQTDEKGNFVLNEGGRKIQIGGGGFYFDELKTFASRRMLKLTRKQMELLRMQKRRCLEMRMANAKKWQEHDFVFPTVTGTPWRIKNLSDRHYLKIIKNAGLPHFNLYSLRHSYATLNLLAGTDINTISANLGHTNASFTLDRYTHVLEEMKLRASAKIDDIFFKEQGSEAAK